MSVLIGGYPTPAAIEQDLVLHTQLFEDIQEETGVDLWPSQLPAAPAARRPGQQPKTKSPFSRAWEKWCLPGGHYSGWAVTEEHTEHCIRMEQVEMDWQAPMGSQK